MGETGEEVGGPGRSEAGAAAVRTPAKLSHIFLWFAGENASRRAADRQDSVGSVPRSGQYGPY